jgi:hypothetical protein
VDERLEQRLNWWLPGTGRGRKTSEKYRISFLDKINPRFSFDIPIDNAVLGGLLRYTSKNACCCHCGYVPTLSKASTEKETGQFYLQHPALPS